MRILKRAWYPRWQAELMILSVYAVGGALVGLIAYVFHLSP